VDFLRHKVRVDRQLVQVSGAPSFGPPKTSASRRVVPLPNVVADELARHIKQFGTGDDGLIFTSGAGEPLRRTRFGEVWRTAIEEAKAPSVGFHQLRHFYASVLIGQGASVKVVQERLGHASAVETLNT
jgi:integrase